MGKNEEKDEDGSKIPASVLFTSSSDLRLASSLPLDAGIRAFTKLHHFKLENADILLLLERTDKPRYSRAGTVKSCSVDIPSGLSATGQVFAPGSGGKEFWQVLRFSGQRAHKIR